MRRVMVGRNRSSERRICEPSHEVTRSAYEKRVTKRQNSNPEFGI
jgi:hypothetical protein